MIINNLPIEEYHARSELSSTGLNLFARSPAHYRAGHRSIGDDTARIGHALHDAALEGGAHLVDVPDWSKASKSDRERWRDWFADQGATIDTSRDGPGAARWFGELERQTGLYALSPDERALVHGMATSLRSHPTIGQLLAEPGVSEQSIIGEVHGVAARCRPDRRLLERPIVVDIKTAIDAREHKFRLAAADRRMHVAQWWYSSLVHDEFGFWPRFVFAIVEKSPPYAAAAYELDEDTIENARYLVERDAAAYRQCLETDHWPSYPGNESVSIPVYDAEPEIAITIGGVAA